MYVYVENNRPRKISKADFSRLYPNVSFPSKPQADTLAEYKIFPLVEQEKPKADVVEKGPIENIRGVWTQTYTGRDYTQAELEQRTEAKRRTTQVSMRQARLALLQAGQLASVEAAIAALPEPQRSAIQIEWEYAHVVDRASPWMTAMGAALGLTETDLDGLFELALTL